jgi:hypothetical protein
MAYGVTTYPDAMIIDSDEFGFTETLTPEDNLMEKLKSLLPDPKAKGKPVWEKTERYHEWADTEIKKRREMLYGVDWGF